MSHRKASTGSNEGGEAYSWLVDRDQIHAAVAAERCRIADLIDSLADAQLATASLCAGWDVKTVAAHLVTPLADGTVRSTLLGLCRGSWLA